MSIKSMLILAAALSGFAYAGPACCGGATAKAPEKTEEVAPAVKSAVASIVVAQPQTEMKAGETVVVASKPACETACAAEKTCTSCAKADKPACDAKAATADGAKTCGDTCACKG